MSVSKRETPFSFVASTDHRGSIWQEIPGRDEIAVKPWQQTFLQSLSEGDVSGPEPDDWRESEVCPQQSWEAKVLPTFKIMPKATRDKTIRMFFIILKNIFGDFLRHPFPMSRIPPSRPKDSWQSPHELLISHSAVFMKKRNLGGRPKSLFFFL